MRKRIRYYGIFFDLSDVVESAVKIAENDRLAKIIKMPHVTYEYKPDYVPMELFGSKVSVTVDGYGNDGDNEGFHVSSIETDEAGIYEGFDMIEVPHITISISSTAEAFWTKDIEFRPVETFVLHGTFGGVTDDGELLLE